jgi:MFS family permease
MMGWFSKKRGVAFGILATGSSAGGVIFPIMLSRSISSIGFGWAMRISAFLILCLLVVANLTVRTRHPPQPHKLSGEQILKPFREPGFLVMLAGMFLLTFGIYVPLNYLPSEAVAAGVDPTMSHYLVAIFNAASMVGRLVSGYASDTLGKFNTFCVSCYIAGISILAFWIPAQSQDAIIAVSVLVGCFSGAYISLVGALVAQISPLPEIGYRTGLVFLFAALPSLATNPIAGVILSSTGSWIYLMVFSGIFTLVGTTVVWTTRIMHVGWKLSAVF